MQAILRQRLVLTPVMSMIFDAKNKSYQCNVQTYSFFSVDLTVLIIKNEFFDIVYVFHSATFQSTYYLQVNYTYRYSLIKSH